MASIKALIHVSSFSTFYPKDILKDEVVDFPYHPKAFVKVMSDMDDDEAEKFTPSVLGRYPNTYTFTKTMSEVLLKEEAKDMMIPVAIARPPFVFPAFKTPASGWFDSVQTLPSLITLYSAGILRTIGFHPDTKAEYMPADMLANSLIAMAWYMASDRCPNNKLMTFNMCSSVDNPITIQEFSRIASEVGHEYPSIRALRPPKDAITYLPNKVEYPLRKFISHTMFAYLVDTVLYLCGQKTM